MEQKAPHLAVGNKGEETAARYLRRLGYKLYGCNVRVHRDEVDIIAYDPSDKVIVFAEVKTRSHDVRDFGPELNLTGVKLGRIERAADTWVFEHGYSGGYRVDVVFVVGGKVVDHWKEVEFGE